jgi:hypothetical protein
LLPKICIKTKVAYFGSPEWYKQESQNLGAGKTNGINRRAKIWEQEKQMV